MKNNNKNYIHGFQKYFPNKILEIRDLNHKGNNQIFKISLVSGEKNLLKKYSRIHMNGWPRGETEFKSMSFLWEKGFREIPKPLKYFEMEKIAIYSFEEGKILNPSEIRENDIKHSVSFLLKLHHLSVDDKKRFGPASSACLSLQGYIDTIKNRFSKIKDYSPEGKWGERGRKILDEKIYPTISKLEDYLIQKSKILDIETQKELSLENQVLTPADFGFHNILKNGKKYIFLDFEYFGRDDPARQVIEFFHHGKSKEIKKELRELFVNTYKKQVNSSIINERMELVEPFVKMTWAIICLHPLSKSHLEHLKFSHGNRGEEYFNNLIGQRLDEAEKRLEEIKIE